VLYYSVFTRFQKNILVDNDGIARLGGLGSAFSLSLPASWSDAEAERSFCGIAPELFDPQASGLVHARTAKATDVYAFGMLAWEVGRIFMRLSISGYSSTGLRSRSFPECPRSLKKLIL